MPPARPRQGLRRSCALEEHLEELDGRIQVARQHAGQGGLVLVVVQVVGDRNVAELVVLVIGRVGHEVLERGQFGVGHEPLVVAHRVGQDVVEPPDAMQRGHGQTLERVPGACEWIKLLVTPRVGEKRVERRRADAGSLESRVKHLTEWPP